MTRLIDPAIASAVARRIAGDASEDVVGALADLERRLGAAVPRSEVLVAEASGIPAPPPVKWGVISRASWAEANIAGMTTLIAPLTDKIARRLESLPVPIRLLQRGLVSAEIGALLGYVSRRVLGQYDLLMGDGAAPPGRGERRRRRELPPGTVLYFVGANMIQTERRLRFVPEDFALWVAVHEVTHRFQFAGVPWLRGHFFDLVGRYMSSLELDARDLAGRLAAGARRLASRSTPAEERNPIYLLANEEQRATLNELQALMAVVEGHGNFVMDLVGSRVIPSFARMRSVFESRRRQVGAVQRAFNYAIGLEMKLRQYEIGQRFCEEVYRREGEAALAALWTSPATFPNLTELGRPELWLKRVA